PSISPVPHAEFRGEVSTDVLARSTQNESPRDRLGPLGASTRAMAHEAPLGGWCPLSCGAQHIEIAKSEDDNALRVAPTHHIELANLRDRAADRNALPTLQVNRPFASGRLGQRRDLPLTNSPLGGHR